MLNVICTTSEKENDDFVGLRFENEHPKIVFPRGYEISSDDQEIRQDIIRLLSTIHKFRNRYEGEEIRAQIGDQYLSFPLLSYQYIIQDFLTHGYYTEKEIRYADSTKGKVNWKRTIQQKQPKIDGANAVYLEFVVRQNGINDNNLITKIHEYCVYESFKNLGWLYTFAMPKKPSIPFNKRMFLSILNDSLRNTNDIGKKNLFSSMINVVSEADELFDTSRKKAFGVNRFEYVWEGLVDYVFGDENKEEFFPHSTWEIVGAGGVSKVNSPLEPDTIIKHNGSIYIIDAKYYKYGITYNPDHLPGTSSIQKQITYGEYIERITGSEEIYNAFVMPYNKHGEEANYKFVSVGKAEWKESTDKCYEFVLGILLDTRHLINTYSRKNVKEIEELSSLIEGSLEGFRRA